jgi:hypothetical protein
LRSPLIVRVDPNLVYVEEETVLGFRIEDAPQILLGLANIFGDDGAQIDAV